MCHVATGANYDRPINQKDVGIVKEQYPEVNPKVIDELYAAITDNHTPQPAVLIALTELFSRGKRKDNGLYDWPVIPFSALELQTWKRIQTKEMLAFHSVFESMALAQRNMQLVNAVFNKYGLQFILFCDCGCGAPELSLDVFNTQEYQMINAVRSEFEALGTEIVIVESFNDPLWFERDLDMGDAEVTSYQRMWEVLNLLPKHEFKQFSNHAQRGMEYLYKIAVNKEVTI
ncbi:MAG: hypothetical protein MRY57_03520 [Candidatus Pacebacteria bacterium]|nr:hypothetical protein [Candidatus Paceibacterota bacterium]